MTAGQLKTLAGNIGAATGEFENARKAVELLARNGKLTGDALAQASAGAVSLAQVTGDSIECAAKEMEKVAREPAKGMVELNDKYNFLTAAVHEHVVALERQGKETEAVAIATAAASEEFQRRAEEMKASTGELTGLVGTLRKEWRLFANDLRNLATPTLDTDIAATHQKLTTLQSGAFVAPRYLLPGAREQDVAALKEQLRVMTLQRDEQQQMAKDEAFATRLRREGVGAVVEINGVLEKAKGSTEKLTDSTRKLKESYEALRVSNPTSDLLKVVTFGANGSISGGSYDKALGQLVKDAQKGQARPKANTDDNSVQTLIDRAKRQISANEELAESGQRVTESSRVILDVEQRLTDHS